MSTLHITNGDCAGDKMRVFLRDPVITVGYALFDGPLPSPCDALIGDITGADEIVLWFEHDLFDQLLILWMLHLIRTMRAGSDRVSMICIDRFPGVEPFYGLGQLTVEQLATLTDTRRPVSDEQFALAARAWTAFTSPDPHALAELARHPDDALPFLRKALKRFLQQYPWTTNGLSRTADAVLRELETGPRAGGSLFVATQAREEHPFMGDWSLFDVVRELAAARVPLVTIDPPSADVDLRGHTIAITDAGHGVLAGRHDAVALNGIDVWRGGVHLVDDRLLRWDPGLETLVEC